MKQQKEKRTKHEKGRENEWDSKGKKKKRRKTGWKWMRYQKEHRRKEEKYLGKWMR